MLGEWVVAPELQIWAARVFIFIVVMIVGGIVAWLVREIVRASGLSGTDRVLGSMFGFGRGALIVGLAVIVLEYAGLDADRFIVVGVSLFATLLSTISYRSMPGESLGKGPVYMANYLAYPLIFWIIGFVLLPVYMLHRVTRAY